MSGPIDGIGKKIGTEALDAVKAFGAPATKKLQEMLKAAQADAATSELAAPIDAARLEEILAIPKNIDAAMALIQALVKAKAPVDQQVEALDKLNVEQAKMAFYQARLWNHDGIAGQKHPELEAYERRANNGQTVVIDPKTFGKKLTPDGKAVARWTEDQIKDFDKKQADLEASDKAAFDASQKNKAAAELRAQAEKNNADAERLRTRGPTASVGELGGRMVDGAGNLATAFNKNMAVDSNSALDQTVSGVADWTGDAIGSATDLVTGTYRGMGRSTKSFLGGIGGAIAGAWGARALLDFSGIGKVPVIGGLLKTVASLAGLWMGFMGVRKLVYEKATDGPDYRSPAAIVGQLGSGRHPDASVLAGAPQVPTDSVDAPAASADAPAGTKPDGVTSAPATPPVAPSVAPPADTTSAPATPPATVRVQCLKDGVPCTVELRTSSLDAQTHEVLETGEQIEKNTRAFNSQGITRFTANDMVTTAPTLAVMRGTVRDVSDGGYEILAFKPTKGHLIRIENMNNTPFGAPASGDNARMLDMAAIGAIQRNATLARTGADPNAALALSI